VGIQVTVLDDESESMSDIVRASLPQLAMTAVLVVLASVMGLGWAWVLVCGAIGLVGGLLRRRRRKRMGY
jgi:multidrug efflux pump subunit AcrB